MKLYYSTGYLRDKTAEEAVNLYQSFAIIDIELSGGKYDPAQEKYLISQKNNFSFQVHNYFPPPKVPFVLNLASTDSTIGETGLSHVKNAIQLASKLGCKYYSLHAGFRIDPPVKDLGKTLTKTTVADSNLCLSIFQDRIITIAEYASNLGMNILIENNVISRNNYNNYGMNPLLLTSPEDIYPMFKILPQNVKILLDMAHLKVSANTLGFDPKQFMLEGKDKIIAYHISENDGFSDQNLPVREDSWFWEFLDKNTDYLSLEVYGITERELALQGKLTREILKI